MRGFTLIEAIVYLALLSVLIAGAITSFYSILGTSESSKHAATVEGEGSFVMMKIEDAISQAEEILSPPEQGSELRVRTDEETISIKLIDGEVVLARDGEAEPLTTTNVMAAALTFMAIEDGVAVSLVIDGQTFEARHYLSL